MFIHMDKAIDNPRAFVPGSLPKGCEDALMTTKFYVDSPIIQIIISAN